MPAFITPIPILKRPRAQTNPTHTTHHHAPVYARASNSDTPPSPQVLTEKVHTHLLEDEQVSDLSTPSAHPLPIMLDLLNYHARTAQRSGKATLATRLYNRAISTNSSDGRAWLGLARLHATSDIPTARRTFRSAVRAAPKNPYLLQAWGVLEERLQCIARARGLYHAATRADPNHAPSWVALGVWEQRHGSIANARDAFRRAADADPRNYYVWHVWGVLELESRQVEKAREFFEKGISCNPRNAATYVTWGRLEDTLGNYSKATELFDKAHRASPRNARAYVSHAVAAERAGDVMKARRLLQRAIGMRSGDAAPRQTLGLLEFRAGNVEKARKHFQMALKANSRHAPTFHAWACVELSGGDRDTARKLFQEAVWSAPKSAHAVRAFHSWACLELEAGEYNLARRYFGHGLEIDARSVPLLTGLAKLEATSGNMARARDCLERCVKLQPTTRATWRLYEELEDKYGSPQRARLVYERCIVTSRQVEERLIVSDAMPGDFRAGGMWIDALEISPLDSAFQKVSDGSGGKMEGNGAVYRKPTRRKKNGSQRLDRLTPEPRTL